MCYLWSINSSWHRTLKIVGSHSKDPLLSHRASLTNSLWNGCLCQHLIWLLTLDVPYSSSFLHIQSHMGSHIQIHAQGHTDLLECPPSYARLGCSHIRTGVIISYGARALPELIKCFSSPSSLLNSQAPLSEPESSISKRQQQEGQSSGPDCWSQCAAINGFWLVHNQASWKGGGGAVSYAYNILWISSCLEVPG